MSDFRPEYPGDNENRADVRRMLEEKGIKIDYFAVIRNMSEPHVRWQFNQILAASAGVKAEAKGD